MQFMTTAWVIKIDLCLHGVCVCFLNVGLLWYNFFFHFGFSASWYAGIFGGGIFATVLVMYAFVTLQLRVASKCYIKKIIKHVVQYVAQGDSSNSVSLKNHLIKI